MASTTTLAFSTEEHQCIARYQIIYTIMSTEECVQFMLCSSVL